MRIGDSITGVTSAVGVPPCAGCKRRAEALNRISDRRALDRPGGRGAGRGRVWDPAMSVLGSVMIGAASLALRRMLRE
jgi:hypothetical protein